MLLRLQGSTGTVADLGQLLVDHVNRGEVLDLSHGEEVTEDAMRSWGEERTIPATVLRDILRGCLATSPDPHGLRLRGARVQGRLDLENLATEVPLDLRDCLLPDGVVAVGARLTYLVLDGCLLEHPTLPPLDARQLVSSSVSLCRVTLKAASKEPALHLEGARIAGSVHLRDATLHNGSGPALDANSAQVDQDVYLTDGFEAVGHGELGAVRLHGTRLGGGLACYGATLHNETGPALLADGVQIEQNVQLVSGFSATGNGESGTVRLIGARIGGVLDCAGATLRNETGPALLADGVQVALGAHLNRGFEAVGNGPASTVRLIGGRFDELTCTGATLRNDAGPALFGDGIQVEQSMHLSEGFTAFGHGACGGVQLRGARIGASLYCANATLHNNDGSALSADGIQVNGSMRLSHGFEAIGHGEDGAVRLFAGRIGGQLVCSNATLRNDTGPALIADGLRVDQDVLLGGKFEAVGSGKTGTLRLPRAHVSGSLDCRGATLRNASGPALRADGLRVDQNVVMTDEMVAIGGGDDCAIRLVMASIGGDFIFKPRAEHPRSLSLAMYVDGLEFKGMPPEDRHGWLTALRDATPAYAAQPYQHLAAVHRAAGHDRDARRVLIAQRKDQLRRAAAGPGERFWGRLTRFTLGYGYQTWRALIGLLAVMFIAVLLTAVGPGAHGGLTALPPAETKSSGAGARCTGVDRIGIGLDYGLPLIKTGSRSHCDTTDTTEGQVLTVAGWGLQAFAWGFATLFVAGFTSAVRKT